MPKTNEDINSQSVRISISDKTLGAIIALIVALASGVGAGTLPKYFSDNTSEKAESRHFRERQESLAERLSKLEEDAHARDIRETKLVDSIEVLTRQLTVLSARLDRTLEGSRR